MFYTVPTASFALAIKLLTSFEMSNLFRPWLPSERVRELNENAEEPLLPVPEFDSENDDSSSDVPNQPVPENKKYFGGSLNKQAQKILRNVHSFFKQDSKNPVVPSKSILKRAALATGIGKRTVQRYLKLKEVVDTPRKKRTKRPKKFLKVDEFMLGVIRRAVYYFYAQNIPPTAEMVMNKVKEDTAGTNYAFTGGITTFRKILRFLGFRWRKVTQDKSVLIESYRIKKWRHQYIRKIREARRNGIPIVWLDETWFNSGDAECKSWVDGTDATKRKIKISGKGKRIIIVHAGSDEGWVEDALFVLCTKDTSESHADYHDDMDAHNFEKWFTEKLLPKLKPGTLIVMDNASYHSRKDVKIPRPSWTLAKIKEWLDENNIHYPKDERMLKSDLLYLTELSNIKDSFAVENLAKRFGCEVARLPPYHCHLNPIEMTWSQIKGQVRRVNATGDVAQVKQEIFRAVDKVTSQNWTNYVRHVIAFEDQAIDGEIFFEREIEPFIINVDSGSESSSTEDDSSDSE